MNPGAASHGRDRAATAPARGGGHRCGLRAQCSWKGSTAPPLPVPITRLRPRPRLAWNQKLEQGGCCWPWQPVLTREQSRHLRPAIQREARLRLKQNGTGPRQPPTTAAAAPVHPRGLRAETGVSAAEHQEATERDQSRRYMWLPAKDGAPCGCPSERRKPEA